MEEGEEGGGRRGGPCRRRVQPKRGYAGGDMQWFESGGDWSTFPLISAAGEGGGVTSFSYPLVGMMDGKVPVLRMRNLVLSFYRPSQTE